MARNESSIDHECLTLGQILLDEYVNLHGPLPDDFPEGGTDATTQSALFRLLAQREQSALCLSGGGIRSATFNLGILQGLASRGLLDNFDYLSTVSGGGYIGGWLSAWIHRHHRGLEGVKGALSQRDNSEPPPVTYLRSYTNYLSPQTGILSVDSWTLAATILRNLFLNWIVFIPLIFAVLMLPRVFVAALLERPPAWFEPVTLGGGLLVAAIGMFYAALHLPGLGHRRESTQLRFLVLCLAPLVLSAGAFTYFWAQLNDGSTWSGWHSYLEFILGLSVAQRFMLFGALVLLVGWVEYVAAGWDVLIATYRHGGTKELSKSVLSILLATLLVLVAGAVTGYVAWEIARRQPFTSPIEHIRACVTFSAPLLILLCSLAVTLTIGLTSRTIADEDLEWLARVAAWSLIVIVLWTGGCLLVLYAPEYALRPASFWERTIMNIVAVVGIVSGLFTALGGFSRLTAATDEVQLKNSTRSLVMSRLVVLAAPAFLLFLGVLLASVTNWFLVGLSNWLSGWISDGQSGWLLVGVNPRDHVAIVSASPFKFLVAVTAGSAIFGWLVGLMLDTSKFSIHAVYGNRLKRAYLGASRTGRSPDWFTGLDYDDDLPLHELRQALLTRASLIHAVSLITNLRQGSEQRFKELSASLSTSTQELIQQGKLGDPPTDELVEALINDLNQMIEGKAALPEMIRLQLNLRPASGETRVLETRAAFEAIFPDEIASIARPQARRPLHVVNAALNVMKGARLAWQERKAESFTFSSLHSGNYWLGYRRSCYYGGDNGISLGTALTISGAAANPNMGYMSTSRLVSFLMAMFNVRLGWWLGNPGKAGAKTFRRGVPRFAVGPVIVEALSLADDNRPYVFLSDGGHFENLGLYEMVLRRCRMIVVSDASTDADYRFDSLGMAIRKIRIDFGIPIEFDEPSGFRCDRDAYCAVGTIRYSCVDETPRAFDGKLLYIKPRVTGGEPGDVVQYKRRNPRFPQESLVDQFFSESQFESYRVLGLHILTEIVGAESNNDLLSGARGYLDGVIRRAAV
jgi:hypothetical protein